jgi:hypothetical protein
MSHKVQVGVPAESGVDTFHVTESVNQVTATGDKSNATRVGGDVPNVPVVLPTATNGVLQTTLGPAKVHVDHQQRQIVTVAGNQMTLEQAQAEGILNVDQEPTKEPEVKPADAEVDPEAPQVTPEEIAEHGAEVNLVGEALQAAGLDPQPAIMDAMFQFANSGTLPDAFSAAVGADSNDIAESALAHLQMRTADAVREAKVDLSDPETLAAISAAFDANLPVIFQALIGNAAPLNQLVATFSKIR